MVNPIDLEVTVQRVKVTMGIIDKCGVRGDATLCVVIFPNYFYLIVQKESKCLGVFVYRDITIVLISN